MSLIIGVVPAPSEEDGSPDRVDVELGELEQDLTNLLVLMDRVSGQSPTYTIEEAKITVGVVESKNHKLRLGIFAKAWSF